MPGPELLSAVKVSELARNYLGGLIGPFMHHSFPVPVLGPKGLLLLFCHGRAEMLAAKGGLQLWPPSYVSEFDARTGKFLRLRALTPKECGLRHAEDQPLGPYLSLAERLQADYLTRLVRWCQAFDTLLPLFVARTANLEPEGLAAVKEFKELTPQVTEAPLFPYYHHLGGEFFAWLNVVQPEKLQPAPAPIAAKPVPPPPPQAKPKPAPVPLPPPVPAKRRPEPSPSSFGTVNLPGGADELKRRAEEKKKGKKP